MSIRRAVATVVAVAAGLLVWGGGPSRAAAPGGGGQQAAINPHWDAARCGECHAAGAAPVAVKGEEADRLCLRCHDGRRASAEAHPIGPAMAKGRDAPAGWPLNGGRIGCLTCHDVTKACGAKAERTEENAKLLRGTPGKPAPEGRMPARAQLCQNCHELSEFEPTNPHLMLTGNREVIAERCVVCHTEVPDRSAKVRTGRVALRGGETTVCLSCHAKHKDQFNPGHLGAKVKPEMLAFVRAREIVGLVAPIGPELLAEAKAAGGKPTLMPLAGDGTIGCTTCHNPHQLGVFPAGTPLAYRAMRVADGRVVSPVRGDQWCGHCHDL
jgi:predicted CXXCH cytochrome family protein